MEKNKLSIYLQTKNVKNVLVMAQNLVPGRVGVATGVILGLGFITGGVGVPITGAIADRFGIQAALLGLAVLAVLAALLALTIPSDRSLRVRMTPPDPAAGPQPATEPPLAPAGARR